MGTGFYPLGTQEVEAGRRGCSATIASSHLVVYQHYFQFDPVMSDAALNFSQHTHSFLVAEDFST